MPDNRPVVMLWTYPGFLHRTAVIAARRVHVTEKLLGDLKVGERTSKPGMAIPFDMPVLKVELEPGVRREFVREWCTSRKVSGQWEEVRLVVVWRRDS